MFSGAVSINACLVLSRNTRVHATCLLGLGMSAFSNLQAGLVGNAFKTRDQHDYQHQDIHSQLVLLIKAPSMPTINFDK